MSSKKSKGKTKKVSQNDLRKMMNDMKNKRTVDVTKARDNRALISNPEAYKKALNDRMKLQALIAEAKTDSTQKNVEVSKTKNEKSEKISNSTKNQTSKALKRPLDTKNQSTQKTTKSEKGPEPKVAKTWDLSKEKKSGGLLIGDYRSDSEEEVDTTEKIEEKMETDDPKPTPSATTSSDTVLPEGFFDDPEVDAKMRGVETPADAMDREWEDFQKEIKRETDQSEQIVEEEQEVGNMDRQIEEIDEQIMHFSRVEKLNVVKDGIKKKVKEKPMETGSDDDESGSDEVDELLDWREKDSHF